MRWARWDSRISAVLGAPAFTSARCSAAGFLRSERQRADVIVFSPMRTGLSQEGQRKKEELCAGSASSNRKLRLFPLLLYVCLL